ncbi:MAG TPA: UDP-N-acetylmuramoyl-L-alanine--D-glutamate ligase [Candidatus Saccharimonadales bacterium]
MGLIDRRDTPLSGQRRTVAIAGFGLEGKSILEYLQKQGGESDITILDQQPNPKIPVPDGVSADLRPTVFESELNYDQVWRASPQIAPQRLKAAGELRTLTQEFFANCPAPIIGVTGTKGKGTTSTLIAKILEADKQTVHLVGNIGQPALSVLDKIKATDYVVFELSSFQLWDLKQSPQVAVVLMVEPEHLDVHDGLDDYIQAKCNIARWQGPDDVVIYHSDNQLSAKIASVGLGKKIKYLTTEGAHIRGGEILINEQNICSVEAVALPGKHNLENICAAVTAAWQYTQNTQAIKQVVTSFKGLPHRLQLVSVKNGVEYVDDSFGTTPQTAIAAIESYSEPKILILGGSDKGSNFEELAAAVKSGGVKKVLLIGQMAQSIRATLDKIGYKQYVKASGSMSDIVKQAASMAVKGDVVLLSPACASFDMFKNYVDRADQFVAAVRDL